MREQIHQITGSGVPARGAARALLASQSDMRGTTAPAAGFTNDFPKTTELVDPTIHRRPPLE